MMKQFIEIDVQTHHSEDWFYTYYNKYIFYTEKIYNHNELSTIMKNTQQVYRESENSCCCMEIDFDELCNKLAEHEIYRLLPVERYYFNIEDENE